MIVDRKLALALCGAMIGLLGVTGCADRPRDVPSAAMITADGTDRVVYTADRPGTMWVANADNHKILYSAPVHAGDRVSVDPDHNQVTVNDRVVLNTGVHHERHRVFFEPSTVVGVGEAVVPATVTVTPVVPVTPAPTVVVTRPLDVPSSATILHTDSRDSVDVRPQSDGTVWVVRADDNRVVYSGRVMAGDHFVVDPPAGRLMLNGLNVTDQRIVQAPYRVYFMPSVSVR